MGVFVDGLQIVFVSPVGISRKNFVYCVKVSVCNPPDTVLMLLLSRTIHWLVLNALTRWVLHAATVCQVTMCQNFYTVTLNLPLAKSGPNNLDASFPRCLTCGSVHDLHAAHPSHHH